MVCLRNGYFLILFVLTFNISSIGQSIYTADSLYVGEYKALYSQCKEGIKEKLKSIEYATIDIDSYCDCYLNDLIPTLELKNKVSNSTENLIDYLISDENLLNKLLSCFESENIALQHSYSRDTKTNTFKKAAINNCFFEMRKDQGISQFLSEPEMIEYCSCLISGILDNGYTLKEIESFNSIDSKVLEEVGNPCAEAILKSAKGNKNSEQSVKTSTEASFKEIIKELNDELKGSDFGSGIVNSINYFSGVLYYDITLKEGFTAPTKEQLISNFTTLKIWDFYKSNNIKLSFIYRDKHYSIKEVVELDSSDY